MSCGAILIILLVRKVVGKKTGAWWRSIIWLMLLVRLLFPVSISSPLSLYRQDNVQRVVSYFTDTKGTSKDTGEIVASVIPNTEEEPRDSDIGATVKEDGKLPTVDVISSEDIAEKNVTKEKIVLQKDNISTTQPNNTIHWTDIAIYIYLCGLVVSLSYLIVRMVTLNISMNRLEECKSKKILVLFEKAKKEMKVKKSIRIFVDCNVSVPALTGVFSPKLILPQKAIQRMSEKQLEFVFTHELLHYKRCDILKLWFVEFVLCIHWFNPLLHYIKSIIRQDIELACDEKIIQRLKETDFIEYCNVLMQSSIQKYRHIPGIITANMAGKRGKKLKERLTMINNFNKKRIWIFGTVILIVVTMIITACTTMGINNPKETDLGVTIEEMNSRITTMLDESNNLSLESDIEIHSSDRKYTIVYPMITMNTDAIKGKNDDGDKTLTFHFAVDTQGEIIWELEYALARNESIKKIDIIRNKRSYPSEEKAYSIFEETVLKAYIMAEKSTDTFSEYDVKELNLLRTIGTNSDNTISFSWDVSYKQCRYTLSPVKIPNANIDKMQNGIGLGVTVDEIIKDVDDLREYALHQKMITPIVNIDDIGRTTLTYAVAKDANGDVAVGVAFLLTPNERYIESIHINNHKHYSSMAFDQEYSVAVRTIKESFIREKEDIDEVRESGSLLTSFPNILYDDSVRLRYEIDKDEYAVVIESTSPIGQSKVGDANLQIVPKQINEKIEYLIENLWIDTPLEFDAEDYQISLENNHTTIRYPLLRNNTGITELELVYTLAKDDTHIQSITAINHSFFNRGMQQEMFIDLNIIAKKACELAVDNTSNLKGAVELEDKPMYMNQLDGEVIIGHVLDSRGNKCIALITTAVDINVVMNYLNSQIDTQDTGIQRRPITMNEEIEAIINRNDLIPTKVVFDIEKESQIKNNYDETIEAMKYPIEMSADGEEILTLYYILNENQIFIDEIYILYRQDLGNALYDARYLELCSIVYTAYQHLTSTTGIYHLLPEQPIENLAEWDLDGLMEVVETDDHQTLVAKVIGRPYSSYHWLRDEVQVYTDLGVTLTQMQENITHLGQFEQFKDVNIDMNLKISLNGHKETFYEYVVEGNHKGNAIVSYTIIMSEDSQHIKKIMRQYRKDLPHRKSSKKLKSIYQKLGEMIDIAFVMAKEGVTSYDEFESVNYPLPKATSSSRERVPVAKMFDGTVYIIDGRGGAISEEYWISTPNLLFELLYFAEK